ncbi:helix-turn-helix transcriptional regulator [Litorivicinus lipolyticus]|uniref:helix-turn-helix transcriptional regulator n=1 Tax=Litorivicinus lipolyticus TaxID=418701 RepID=UPI003B59DDA9
MTSFQFMRMHQVVECVGLCRSQVYKMISAGDFPPPIKLASNVSAWSSQDIEQWMLSKVNGQGWSQ